MCKGKKINNQSQYIFDFQNSNISKVKYIWLFHSQIYLTFFEWYIGLFACLTMDALCFVYVGLFACMTYVWVILGYSNVWLTFGLFWGPRKYEICFRLFWVICICLTAIWVILRSLHVSLMFGLFWGFGIYFLCWGHFEVCEWMPYVWVICISDLCLGYFGLFA